MESGTLERQYHAMITPEIPRREEKKFTLGRVAARGVPDMVVCQSDFVSRRHCEIYFRHGAFWVKDLKSLNGTFLNGQKLVEQTERELRFGDILGIGVSHDSTDVNPTDPEYFVFVFKAHQFEVIDLDEDEDQRQNVESSGDRKENAPVPGTSAGDSVNAVVDIISESETEGEEIQIIEKTPHTPTPAKVVSKLSPLPTAPRPPVIVSKPTTKPKPLPPPPPPPVITSKPLRPATPPAAIAGPSRLRLSNESNPSSVQSSPIVKSKETKSHHSSNSNSSKSKTPLPKFKAPVHHLSTESTSADDSSDGMSENFNDQRSDARKSSRGHSSEVDDAQSSRCSSGKRSQIQSGKSNVSKLSDGGGNDKSAALKTNKKDDKPLTNSIDRGQSVSPTASAVIKSEPIEVDTTQNLVVLLKQLIQTSKKEGPSMRKGKAVILSEENRQRIFSQWKSSERSCKSRLKHKNVSDSDSSDSSDMMIPLNNTSKSTKRFKGHKSDQSNSSRKRKSSDKPYDRITGPDSSNSTDSDTGSYGPQQKRTKTSENVLAEKTGKVLNQSPKKKDKSKSNGAQSSSKEHQRYTPSSPVRPRSSPSDISDNDFELDEPSEYYSDVSDADLRLDQSDGVSKEDENDGTSNNDQSSRLPDLNHDDYRKAQGRRQAVFLETPPMPPNVKRQFLHSTLLRTKMDLESIKRPPIPVKKWYGEGSSNSKSVLQNKLRAINQKPTQGETSTKQVSPEGPKAPAPVKSKVTSRNRNDNFIESMMADANAKSEEVQKELERAAPGRVAETVTPPEKRVAAPRREIPPLPSPSTQSRMPYNTITESMNKQGYGSVPTNNQSMPPPPPPRFPVQAPNSINRMEKPGVTHARSVASNSNSESNFFEYGHNSSVPTKKKVRGSDKFVPVLHDDEAYKCILKWRPMWLEEQKVRKDTPPVLADREAIRVLMEYETYNSYVETFFPLLLLEIWAIITQDHSNKRKNRGEQSVGAPHPEYPISIDVCQRVGDCPMTTRQQNRKDDGYWIKINCHTVINQLGEISQKRDFAIVTLSIHQINESKKVMETVEKKFFGWILMHDGRDERIADPKTIVNPKLTQKNSGANFKHSMFVVIHSRENMDSACLGKIQPISYIGPKLRDAKALNYLRHSKLYDSIINPKAPKVAWNQHAAVPQNQLVQHVSKLNVTQKSVVAHIVERVRSEDPELLLLHGPPGTGKTRTIVGMILQILLTKNKSTRDQRILVCTPSNTAIDEIMQRLEEALKELPTTSSKEIKMVRIGETECPGLKRYSLDNLARQHEQKNSIAAGIQKSIDQCKKERTEKDAELAQLTKSNGSKPRIEAVKRELKDIQIRLADHKADLNKRKVDKGNVDAQRKLVVEKANVVCSTLNSCSNSFLFRIFGHRSGKTRPFLCCIVDEASQTTEPETLAPLVLQVDKLVLVGDPNQLGATVLSQEAESKNFGLSLFARLHHYYTQINRSTVMMLTHQYRMHPDILQWPNDMFYKSLLKTQCMGRSEDEMCPLKPYLFLNLSSQETSNREGQISNDEEAKMVVEIIRNIFVTINVTSKRTWSIGVITPYSTQKEVIINALKRQLQQHAELVEVNTVDSFQGREKDIIIISCVRTDDTGFLKNLKRLNVALTRARHSLLIVGDAKCLEKDGTWKSLIEDARKRGCEYLVPSTKWSDPGFLKKRLFNALSPRKSQISDIERKRDWLGN